MKKPSTPAVELVLLGRDPRNHAHRRRAFEIIKSKTGMHMSQQSFTELKNANVPLPKKFKIVKKPSKYPMVAEFFLLEYGLMFEDNMIAKCDGCSQYVQFRPHAQAAKIKLCCYCVVDRIIAEETQKVSQKSTHQRVTKRR